MADFTITIDQIFPGVSPSEYFNAPGQYKSGIAIDPDLPISDSAIRISGFLRPSAMEKFSASEITGVPLWAVTNPKTDATYVYASDGKVHNVSDALAMGTALNSGNALSSASGNGAAYYDNYVYFAKNTDVCRYGPLDGSPSLTQDYWTGTLSKSALANTTYPSVRGKSLPNHVMHRHTDNKLYFADVVGNKGVLHYIATTKTSAEGDTNDGSSYNAIDFPLGYYPTCIESYGTDLVVGLIEGVDTTALQKPAAISFWDTTSSSFSKIIQIELPDPLITAMKNVNGVLYVFTGNASGGYRVLRFAGGYSFQEVFYSEEGNPPLPGAVDHDLNRVLWGTYLTTPEEHAVVYGYGSRSLALGGGVHGVLRATASGTNRTVTLVKYITQANNSLRFPIIGWSDGSASGLDKRSTTYGTSVWESAVFRIGKPFKIDSIRIPLCQAVAANMTLVPKIFYDEGSSSTTCATINTTNYANSDRQVKIKNISDSGKHNFYLQLKWTGTALLTVSLPITIEGIFLND